MVEQHLNEMSLKIRDNLQQVMAEKEKADSILRCMIEGVLVLDPRGRVLVMNEQALSMFHVPAGKDVHGVSILEISRHPEVHRILEEVLTFDFSAQLYSKQIELDEDRWFRVNAVRLRDTRGDFLGSILVFHDTTDIKRFESMRSDFVANVSHELRTPLTAIRGYVETLLHTPPSDPEDSRQFLEIIDRHSERLSRLTEDLLTLSDLESGKIQLAVSGRRRWPPDPARAGSVLGPGCQKENYRDAQSYAGAAETRRRPRPLAAIVHQSSRQRDQVHAGRRPSLADRHEQREPEQQP